MNGLLHGISTSTSSLCKAEIVVGRYVERTSLGTGQMLGLVVVVGIAVVNNNRATCDASDRDGEAVFNTVLQSPSVKRVKVRVQGRVSLTNVSV
jgi:hypothetical protein